MCKYSHAREGKKWKNLKADQNAPRVRQLFLGYIKINISKNSEWRTLIVISANMLSNFVLTTCLWQNHMASSFEADFLVISIFYSIKIKGIGLKIRRNLKIIRNFFPVGW